MAKKQLKIWLSSPSLSDDDLGQIVAVLSKDYEIVYSNELIIKSSTNFNSEEHLEALKKCDLFLGIINPKLANLGINIENIYLEEIKMAMDAKMPYWYLVHRDVTFTRNLLNDLIRKSATESQSKNRYFFDIRTIDIYKKITIQKPSEEGYHQPIEYFRLDELLSKFDNTIINEKSKGIIKLMVASTVYGFEDQLSKIIEDVELNEFKVLNSFHGSIKVNPNLSNLENCIQAVQDTDWFMGIVRPYYGTGNIKDKNITFEEIKTAIEIKKSRWFFIHRDVTFASKIIDKIEVNKTLGDKNDATQILLPNKLLPNNQIHEQAIDLYNFVIKDHETNLELRNGNWAQEFFYFSEALIYIRAQFLDFNFIENLLNTNKNGR